ncbi:UDP-forming cellulose synthase catalytic subunit [Ferrigenium kumadai]|uniref:Cellulose synthase catalytic subunit [UDP-forming] n=1 Tax=Ferrigenium kumadai TaxID=1682490 RepID=A0AAN1VZK7_9PROT|nr:UDP-forming cellulose synthase catalytic subunit [Ferrigenium kumadai]BBI99543.1 UDP-forming cellulose synthase catalytic subunit [Ferrigenium kumadai]
MMSALFQRLHRFSSWFLLACGVDPNHSRGRQLLSLLFVLPPLKPAGYYARLFPHVRFDRLRPGDIIRIPLQLLWLAVIRLTSEVKSPLRQGASWLAPYHRLRAGISNRLDRLAMRLHIKTDADIRHFQEISESFARHRYWDHPLVRYLAYGISALLSFLCITTPFNTTSQLVFVSLLLVTALIIRRIPGQVVTLLLIVLSVTASTRYLWWRITSTLNWDNTFDLTWGILLLLAEIYTWIILVLSYIQSSWPLKRSPVLLPTDTSLWPSVDVFIPTYNEPLKVVKPTIYAAQGMDWPEGKLNVYLLDDGRREEFRRFAEQAGVNYIARPTNEHAKAGNLNHALTKSSGEYIAIFDCDHIPTRSFLQLCMGGFLRDPKLALVQTPHHFYSADPFERNLGVFRSTPNEGELFYGVVQDGNDLWNASFFCGSCAILKRAPLEEIGGVAVETVTEDAHTALKMHRLGYNSAYINIPMAAGLATESLSAHIGQRIRWARGTTQIFRLDNALLGKGLKWAQRLCYSNAALHFFNGIPRLIFLTAPLAVLLFHAYIIYAPAVSLLLYVLPHMAHATIANSRTQGKHRNSFWAEVYETVLAWYIARPTFVALFAPHKGKFNVTAKGGAVDSEYFDWSISLPYLFLIGLSIVGIFAGLWRLHSGPTDEIATIIINLFWVTYNLIILGAAAATALETKQVRMSHRVEMKLSAVLHLANGKRIRCETVDFSEGGIALVPAAMPEVGRDESVMVSLWRGEEELAFSARVLSIAPPQLRLRWELQNQEQEAALVQCTFGRADAWIEWAKDRPADKPFESLGNVLSIGLLGYRRIVEHFLPRMIPTMHRLVEFLAFLASFLPRTPNLENHR